MKKQVSAAAALVIVGMMTGCGSGGSVTSQGSSPSAITGKVADGYLAGATVFLDKNGNYQLNQGEPSATTDANGAYTLTVDPADVGKYPIVALAVKGVTIDSDTNQPVTSSYVLSIPKDAVSGTVSSNFISPVSTQVREMMETGKYATMQQAMDALRLKLGMPAGTNMLADYMAGAGQNGPMHTAAQNMAALMGSQMSLVFSNSSSATKVDVNRYRGMMGAIFSNISSVKGSNAQTSMSNLMSTMTSTLGNITPGQPFANMSSSFIGMGMTGGGMMGSTSGSSMMGR